MENTESNKNNDDKSKRGFLEKKQSLKLKTRPQVRQTVTSYKRMLKANPLLQLQEAGIDIDEWISQKSLGNSASLVTDSKKILDKKPPTNEFKKPESKPLMRTQSLKLPKNNGINIGNKKPVIISGNQPHANSDYKKPSTSNGNNINSNSTKLKPDNQLKQLPKNKIENKKFPIMEVKAKVNSFPNGHPKQKSTENSAKNPKPQTLVSVKAKSLRRSLSSGHLQTKKGKIFDPKVAFTKLNQSQSEETLCIPVSNGFKQFSPIMEDSKDNKDFVFKTPSAYDRRSICHYTPQSTRKSFTFQASTPAPVEMQRLQERLNQWLKSRGKPPASFHNLKVFGTNGIKKTPPLSVIDYENKENIEVIQEKSESYECLKITTTPQKKNVQNSEDTKEIRNEISEENLAKYAKEAMTELLKLIEEDFPRDQCLGWLELIRDKYTKIDEEPEYWECRAAIEQCAGNVHNAVEFYKTAIIQGAEVNTVDKSLDQLLKKFSLLNISPRKAEQKSHAQGDKERIVREARNVFKSSIIQFAIRERNLKKTKDETLSTSSQNSVKKLIAIPVRRSTRLSRSGYVNTSGVQLCTSLREIDLSTEEIRFEKNKALC